MALRKVSVWGAQRYQIVKQKKPFWPFSLVTFSHGGTTFTSLLTHTKGMETISFWVIYPRKVVY
jgi:hypothetical protein